MNKIDVLAYKTNSYDTESFIEDILSYSKKSILLISDFDKITVQYKPADIRFDKKEIRFCRTKIQKLNYYISPLLLAIDMFIFFKLFFTLCYKYRPKICWMENSYVALVVGVMRKLGLCDKSIYVPGDWVAAKDVSRRALSYLGNNFIFPVVDYLACKLNDIVLNHTKEIAEARFKFWGRKITKNEKLYEYKLQIKTTEHNVNEKKSFCFIGDMREDSGIDIAIVSLPEIIKKQDFSFKIIGPQRQHYEHFRNLASEHNVSQYVKFLGFVNTDKLPQVLSDCFCGISLVTSNNSYSAYTISGKLVHYIQYLLPVIVSEGAGAFVSVIRNNALGIVVEPSREAFMEAILKIYNEHNFYRENIIRYINSLAKVDIKELIEVPKSEVSYEKNRKNICSRA